MLIIIESNKIQVRALDYTVGYGACHHVGAKVHVLDGGKLVHVMGQRPSHLINSSAEILEIGKRCKVRRQGSSNVIGRYIKSEKGFM